MGTLRWRSEWIRDDRVPGITGASHHYIMAVGRLRKQADLSSLTTTFVAMTQRSQAPRHDFETYAGTRGALPDGVLGIACDSVPFLLLTPPGMLSIRRRVWGMGRE